LGRIREIKIENNVKISVCRVCEKTFNLPDENDESIQRMMKVVNILKIEGAEKFSSPWDWLMSEQMCSPECVKKHNKPN
jgi:hypothetical protein